jgi:hypothetical protein
VADLWIAAGVGLLAYAFARRRLTAEPISAEPARRSRIVELIVVLAVVTFAVISALDHGGVYSPTT